MAQLPMSAKSRRAAWITGTKVASAWKAAWYDVAACRGLRRTSS